MLRNIEEETLCELRRDAANIGISITDFYKMDMKMMYDYRYGVMKQKELDFNCVQELLYAIAIKVVQGVKGDRNFSSKLKPVDWSSNILPDSEERKIYERQQQMADRILRQYGIDILNQEEQSNGTGQSE